MSVCAGDKGIKTCDCVCAEDKGMKKYECVCVRAGDRGMTT